MVNVVFPIAWLLLSTLLGLLGRKTVLGFWGIFLVALILSPPVGFAVLIFLEFLKLIGESRAARKLKKTS